eukprot:2620117-Rhodomonas_salina.1
MSERGEGQVRPEVAEEALNAATAAMMGPLPLPPTSSSTPLPPLPAAAAPPPPPPPIPPPPPPPVLSPPTLLFASATRTLALDCTDSEGVDAGSEGADAI